MQLRERIRRGDKDAMILERIKKSFKRVSPKKLFLSREGGILFIPYYAVDGSFGNNETHGCLRGEMAAKMFAIAARGKNEEKNVGERKKIDANVGNNGKRGANIRKKKVQNVTTIL